MITKQQKYARSIYKVEHGEFLHKCSDFDWMADIVLKQTSSFFMQRMKKPALLFLQVKNTFQLQALFDLEHFLMFLSLLTIFIFCFLILLRQSLSL